MPLKSEATIKGETMKVTPIKTSRKLEPIIKGVETEKVWYRTNFHVDKSVVEWSEWKLENRNRVWSKELIHKMPHYIETVPAYDLDDLLRMLPDRIVYKGNSYLRMITPYAVEYQRMIYGALSRIVQKEGSIFEYKGVSQLPQALADLLIWCKEHGHLDKSSGTEEEI